MLEVCSDEVDLSAVADVMAGRGWGLDRQPGGLHLMLSPFHARVVDGLLADLADAVADVQATGRRGSGATATYGAAAAP